MSQDMSTAVYDAADRFEMTVKLYRDVDRAAMRYIVVPDQLEVIDRTTSWRLPVKTGQHMPARLLCR